MEGNPKILRIARLLVGKYGGEALAIAVDRAQQRLAIEDYASAAIWARVSEAVHVIAPGQVPREPKRRAEPPLDALIDDPVMEAVTRGDAARRDAVKSTLIRTKRRRRKMKSKGE